MFSKKIFRITLIMILVLLPFTAQSAQEPAWAEHVMSELGCMGGMFGEIEGKVFVDGVIMDDGAKLKDKGFKIESGAPYRVSAMKINDGKYEVTVSRMDQRGVSETKILDIK